VYCLINKTIINYDVRKQLAQQHIPYTKYFTTPAPLQNWLWYVAAGNDSDYYVGYHSVFAKAKIYHFKIFYATLRSLIQCTTGKMCVNSFVSHKIFIQSKKTGHTHL
jgi:hypothetical protein